MLPQQELNNFLTVHQKNVAVLRDVPSIVSDIFVLIASILMIDAA